MILNPLKLQHFYVVSISDELAIKHLISYEIRCFFYFLMENFICLILILKQRCTK